MTSDHDSVGHETTEEVVVTPLPMSDLDRKVAEHFAGFVVRKDLTKGLKQNAVVPTYVLEYLLGQHCATDDPETLHAGLEQVQRILSKHYVHRNEAELVKSTIKERGRHKVIDKVTVELNDKGGFYEARFTNLGLAKVPISDDLARRHPKLLVGGIWAITDLLYELTEEPKASPWHIDSLKPIQVSGADYDEYLQARAAFSSDEWADVIMQSIGLNPAHFSRRQKLLSLLRLVPFCERNYNFIELGPKGTGKSHIYAEFSPHGILISGGEVSQAKLFVNNASGKIGLVGYWDCICFDEFAGKDKNVDKNLVDIMKNYMANKSFSRGIEQLSAEASMVFMGNTKSTMPQMFKHSHFFDQLPDKYIDSAFLDRLHAYLPGWEVDPIRNELFSSGYGFVVDYLAEILRHQRTEDFTSAYKEHVEITSEVSTRDQTGFEKTLSGLMKLLYPHGQATADEVVELLSFSMECRRRVREHILRLDDTFARHDFTYKRLSDGESVTVLTPEELEYPQFAGPRRRSGAVGEGGPGTEGSGSSPSPDLAPGKPTGRRSSPENERPLIEELLARGEGMRVEFKSSARWNYHSGAKDDRMEHEIVRTVAGFMNASGGSLLIGVNDQCAAIGLDHDYAQVAGKNRNGFENWLTTRLAETIGKPTLVGLEVSFASVAGHDVCRVDVPRSVKPVFVTTKQKDKEFWVRTNNSTRLYNAEEAHDYITRNFKA